ncbi:MAG: hypothetical protein RL596_888 [Bacteroidota bacterium]
MQVGYIWCMINVIDYCISGVNRDYATGASTRWFGMELGYEEGYTINQYNGNIAGMRWRSRGDGEQRAYGFAYDPLNRLMKGDFNQFTNGSWNKTAGLDFSMKMGDGENTGTAYDENGNILRMQQWGAKLGGSVQIDNMVYNYMSNSNKLLNVIDAANDPQTRLGDFRSSQRYMNAVATKTNATVDYTYDDNGNLNQDKNKDIAAISYNHLNLPYELSVTGKGTIKYIYDATGNKLEKRTTDDSTHKTTKTAYIGAYVYEQDTLQFMGHEEGRVRVVRTPASTQLSYVYDYFLKDHLGNTRMVLTDEQKTNAYPVASLENATVQSEKNYYNIPDGGSVNKNTVAGYPTDNYTNPNDIIQKLNGNTQPVGTSIVLKVMAGDKVNIRANSWYRLNGATPGTPVSPINDIVAALTGGLTNNFSKAMLYPLPGGWIPPGMADFLTRQTNTADNGKPKAYLNYVLFDACPTRREQLKPVVDTLNFNGNQTTGFEQVGASEEFKTHLITDKEVSRNGYLYIYVSNATQNIDVFFDNVQVTHTRGPLVEETHYYPFGLTMAGISSKAANTLLNRYQYNGGNELQSKEFSDGSGLELYDAVHRLYDPQLGRFFQIDKLAELGIDFTPYGFARNNPIRMDDPLGLKEDTLNGTSPEVIVHTSKKKVASKQLNQMDYGQIAAWIDARTKRGDGAETIGNWALNNPYLTPNTLDKILDANSSAARAIRQAQDEAWELEGKIFAMLLATATGAELLALVEAEAAGVAAGRGVASVTSKAKDIIRLIDKELLDVTLQANFEVRVGLSKFMKNAPDLVKMAKHWKSLKNSGALKILKAVGKELLK